MSPVARAVWVESPTVARVSFPPEREAPLRELLTYRDKKVEYQIARLKHSRWVDPEQKALQMADLQAQRSKCLLFEDDRGHWTWSGLAARVAEHLGVEVQSGVEYPEPQGFGWEHPPEYAPYPYQTAGCERLLAARHGGVQVGTGLGKSFMILHLIRELGLQTTVMAPSASIAHQLFDELSGALGRRGVGLYGDGSKEYKKAVTVAIAASLVRVDPASPAGQRFRRTQVFVPDESHLTPAETLSRVCFELMAAAPYRFFFSATQMRTDGLGLLLDGITGPIVYEKSVAEGIAEGYLSALEFTVVRTWSDSAFSHRDVNEMTRKHLYYNPVVLRQAADLANHFASCGEQTLVLVEELEQYAMLQPLLRAESRFAHGGVSKENRARLPEAFWKSDPTRLVAEFNRSEFPVLVGTTCISTGTNIRANEATINLQGGKSEISVFQGAVGRSTRLHTFPDGRKKTWCRVIDFDVENVPDMHRHVLEREAIYAQVAPVRHVELP